jgi:hypothetical protein
MGEWRCGRAGGSAGWVGSIKKSTNATTTTTEVRRPQWHHSATAARQQRTAAAVHGTTTTSTTANPAVAPHALALATMPTRRGKERQGNSKGKRRGKSDPKQTTKNASRSPATGRLTRNVDKISGALYELGEQQTMSACDGKRARTHTRAQRKHRFETPGGWWRGG